LPVAVLVRSARRWPGRSRAGELKSSGKPSGISKRAVREAREEVKAGKGAPGADGVPAAGFGEDLKGSLDKAWNRMSSGSYFPPPVRAAEIPEPHGGGTRIPGVPSVADRVAQPVAARVLEARAEPVFRPAPMAAGRGVPRWTRWLPAGCGAGKRAG